VIWLDDGDQRLLLGDALEQLSTLPAGSVDCVITSPPYYGLRDYGTGQWEGGDPACDHARQSAVSRANSGLDGATATQGGTAAWRDVCGRCGARRVDRQIGLEESLDAYLATIVAVFRECRRVLADHGTCWINLGSSFASGDAALPLPAKNLVPVPWLVALALQSDGWILRRDIIWSKPNPMPESVSDRPTTAHEYVFLLTKKPRYWYDADAVREPHRTPEADRYRPNNYDHDGFGKMGSGRPLHERFADGGRNLRSVWEIATQPTPDAHFATYPEELVRRCLLAGCPAEVCGECGKPRERIVGERPYPAHLANARKAHGGIGNNLGGQRHQDWLDANPRSLLGWSDCGHAAYRPGVCLDPFVGSGTTLLVARNHARRGIGIDLSAAYLAIAARRLQQLSLLADTEAVP
jgi:DNA modification methylase